MKSLLALAFPLALVLAFEGCRGNATPPAAPELQALWEEGRTFPAFYDDVSRRRALWESNVARSEALDAGMVDRARTAVDRGGPWRILAVTADGCSDSANVLPYVAELVGRVEGLDMRLVGIPEGRPLMRAYPTPDGRAAMPTLLLLDGDERVVGCFIERPGALVEELAALEGDLEASYERKMRWYEEDGGRATVGDVVGMLEAAARGEGACRAAAGS